MIARRCSWRSRSVDEGFELYRSLGAEGHNWLAAAETRYSNSTPALWHVAHLLHPKPTGENLARAGMKGATDWTREKKNQKTSSEVMNYMGEGRDSIKHAVQKMPNCKFVNFIKARVLVGELPEEIGDLAIEILALSPSSTGVGVCNDGFCPHRCW